MPREQARSGGGEGGATRRSFSPDGRESPSRIGDLLIRQQPHVPHLLEYVRTIADDGTCAMLLRDHGEVIPAPRAPRPS